MRSDVRWPTLSKFLNIASSFWSCFLVDTACISNEDFLSNTEMCFGVVVAIDTVLRSLKLKILLRINKSWVQNFPRYDSKCSDQNTKVIQFYPWKMAIPYFSGANDRIKILLLPSVLNSYINGNHRSCFKLFKYSCINN